MPEKWLGPHQVAQLSVGQWLSHRNHDQGAWKWPQAWPRRVRWWSYSLSADTQSLVIIGSSREARTLQETGRGWGVPLRPPSLIPPGKITYEKDPACFLEVSQGKWEQMWIETRESDRGDREVNRSSASPETNESPSLGEGCSDRHIDN